MADLNKSCGSGFSLRQGVSGVVLNRANNRPILPSPCSEMALNIPAVDKQAAPQFFGNSRFFAWSNEWCVS
jgi:hypothetical protein